MTKNTGLKHKCGTLLDRDNVAGYVFILPFIIGLVVFTAIPFFTSLYLAFTKCAKDLQPALNRPF